MASIFREIKRRRMIRTCVLYVLICWGLLQVGDILTPTLGLDRDNFSRIFLFAALGGLPLIILFAWFYQITRDGIVKTTVFVERRVLSNIPPLDDKRSGQADAGAQNITTKEYEWIITAETGPLAGLAYAVSGPLVLGRSLDCDLAIMSPQMSRRHARLATDGGTLTVEDLGSANGTMVNGQRISARQALNNGDTLEFQEIRFQVRESYTRAHSEDSSMNQATVFRAPGGD